ncbi:MAG: tetratricopeptide repeat protein [Myxococcaceae bacterium]|nr:tetratricopeptide repeat protein [Myxococcaceae bacterium]
MKLFCSFLFFSFSLLAVNDTDAEQISEIPPHTGETKTTADQEFATVWKGTRTSEWDDYVGHEGQGDLNRFYQSDPVLREFLGNLTNLTVLDVGCGNGYMSRWACHAGAGRVIAVDISEEFINIAKQHSPKEQFKEIDFRVESGNDLASVPDDSIDRVVSNYVLMDVADLKGNIRRMYEVLRPGATASIVIVHPCFPIKYRSEHDGRLILEWEDSYFATHLQVTPPFDQTFTTPFKIMHHPLEEYEKAFEEAGFKRIKLREPHLTKSQKQHLDPSLPKNLGEIPISIAWLLKKPNESVKKLLSALECFCPEVGIGFSEGENRRGELVEHTNNIFNTIKQRKSGSGLFHLLLRKLGRSFQWAAKDGEKALYCFQMSLRIARTLDSPDVIVYLSDVGELYFEREQYKKSLQCYTDAVDVARQKNRVQLASCLHGVGYLARVTEDYETGLQALEEASVFAQIYDNGQAAIQVSGEIGWIYRQLGEYSKALNLTKAAVDRIRENPQSLDPKQTPLDYAYLINNIALIYRDLHEYCESKKYFEEALICYKNIYKTKDEIFICVLKDNISLNKYSMGRLQEALELAQEVLEQRLKLYPDGQSVDIARSFYNMATMHRELGHLRLALEKVNKSLLMRNQILDNNHSDVVWSRYAIGLVYQDMGRLSDALEVFHQAYSTLDGKKDFALRAALLSALGKLYRSIGQYEEASQKFKEALNFEKLYATEYTSLLLESALLAKDQGNWEELTQFLEQASKDFSSQSFPEVIPLYTLQGWLRSFLDEPEQALALHLKALEIATKAFDTLEIPIMGELYTYVGDSYMALGQQATATQFYEKAHQVRQEVTAREYPFTRRTKNEPVFTQPEVLLPAHQNLWNGSVKYLNPHSGKSYEVIPLSSHGDDCGFVALGATREQCIELIKKHADNPKVQHLLAADMALKAFASDSFQPDDSVPTAEQIKAFLDDEFITQRNPLTYFRDGGGMLEALAGLLNINVSVFAGEAALTKTISIPFAQNASAPKANSTVVIQHVAGLSRTGHAYMKNVNLLRETPPEPYLSGLYTGTEERSRSEKTAKQTLIRSAEVVLSECDDAANFEETQLRFANRETILAINRANIHDANHTVLPRWTEDDGDCAFHALRTTRADFLREIHAIVQNPWHNLHRDVVALFNGLISAGEYTYETWRLAMLGVRAAPLWAGEFELNLWGLLHHRRVRVFELGNNGFFNNGAFVFGPENAEEIWVAYVNAGGPLTGTAIQQANHYIELQRPSEVALLGLATPLRLTSNTR